MYENGEWVLSCGVHEAAMLDELKFTPILRPLSDITEDELMAIGVKPKREWHEPTLQESKKWIVDNQYLEIYSAKEVAYLLSKHFDLFGLIDAGLAIDKTKEAVK
jgi:hypothetical protein